MIKRIDEEMDLDKLVLCTSTTISTILYPALTLLLSTFYMLSMDDLFDQKEQCISLIYKKTDISNEISNMYVYINSYMINKELRSFFLKYFVFILWVLELEFYILKHTIRAHKHTQTNFCFYFFS